MSLEEYPEDIEIKKSNFKTDQQEEAAETIESAWPADLETIAEKGGHVKMFYSQVLADFLGPADAEMTFGEIESEYGSVSDWAETGGDGDGDDAVEVPDVEEIEPGGETTNGESSADATDSDAAATGSDGATTDNGVADRAVPDVGSVDIDAAAAGGEVDEKRREWFAAGFREGVEFALRNQDLFGDR